MWSPEPVGRRSRATTRGGSGCCAARTTSARALDVPRGYVELGETVEDAARRETREELELGIELGRLVGVYSRADDRIVPVVFDARALGIAGVTDEATEVRRVRARGTPWDELAFWSTTAALRDALAVERG